MSDPILKIKNLSVTFPLFGGILQREVSAVHAVKDFNYIRRLTPSYFHYCRCEIRWFQSTKPTNS